MSEEPKTELSPESKDVSAAEVKPAAPKKLKTHKTVPIKAPAADKKPAAPTPTSTAPTEGRKKGSSLLKRICIILIILGIIGGIGMKKFGEWGATQLVTEYITLETSELSPAGPLRIAFIADVHNNAHMLRLAAEEIEKHEPDIIIFGGDMLNAQNRFNRTRGLIKAFALLPKIAPTYAIFGNHDVERVDEYERAMKIAGIPILRNESITWTSPSGKEIRLIGLSDWNEYDEDPAACMKPVGEEELPVILLSHDPESRWLLSQYDWDLMLAGHTHGGQLGNPFTGDFISLRSSMPAGLFDFVGNRKIYVTRGVGATFNMRFFSPPEVTIIDIK